MKILLTIFMLFSLFSCKEEEAISEIINGEKVVTNYSLVASRDYNPSSWSNFSLISEVTGISTVPLEVDVIAGNSGTGWLSLIIGNRKFCYQGNASNNQTPNGDKFTLIREKTDTGTECHSSSNNTAYNLGVNVNSGDSIDLSVNGGGCSNAHATCLFTEVSLDIEITN